MLFEYPVNKIISQLGDDNLLPAILFRTSRKQCDNDIVRLSRTRSAELPRNQKQALEAEIRQILADYGADAEVIHGHLQYDALVNTGAGAHHAGQLLVWRLLLEELMTRGLLRLMIATGTVAAGVDFPARTVVVTAHSKRGSEGFRTLSSSEFQQMSGRAGRRGKDKVGLCLVAPGPFSDARVIEEVSKRPPEPLRSAYFASPSTVLNLLKYRNVDDLRYTVQRSLASFLDRKQAVFLREEAKVIEAELEHTKAEKVEAINHKRKRGRRLIREAQKLEGEQTSLLERTLEGLFRLGYVKEGQLTDKGYWAAHLCTSLVLEIGEAVGEFLFEDLTVEEIVGLVASLSGDPHRTYLSIKKNPIKSEYFEKLSRIVERVKLSFEVARPYEVEVVPDAGLTVMLWMEAENWASFSSYLRLGGVAEGDAARVIMQAGEHLGQIARLYESHPTLATTAAEGKRRIMKPPLSDSMLVE